MQYLTGLCWVTFSGCVIGVDFALLKSVTHFQMYGALL